MASILFLTTEVDDPHRKPAERIKAEDILTVFNPAGLTLFALEADMASDGCDVLRHCDI